MATAHFATHRLVPFAQNLETDHVTNFRLDSRRLYLGFIKLFALLSRPKGRNSEDEALGRGFDNELLRWRRSPVFSVDWTTDLF
jgi:hypothetical protein